MRVDCHPADQRPAPFRWAAAQRRPHRRYRSSGRPASSIAACSRTAALVRCSRHPAIQRSAPLRRVVALFEVEVLLEVIRPIIGRIHCGIIARRAILRRVRRSRADHRPAPLQPDFEPGADRRWPRHPAVPTRHHYGAHGPYPVVRPSQFIRPFNSRLHCGRCLNVRARMATPVIRSINGRLHLQLHQAHRLGRRSSDPGRLSVGFIAGGCSTKIFPASSRHPVSALTLFGSAANFVIR